MSESLATITGTGVPVTIGGEDFTASPLNMADYGLIERFILVGRTKIALQTLDEMGASEAKKTSTLAYLSSLSLEPGELQDALGIERGTQPGEAVDGNGQERKTVKKANQLVQMYAFWLSLRHGTPSLTQGRFEELLAKAQPEEFTKFSAVAAGLSREIGPDEASGESQIGNPTLPTQDGTRESPESSSSTRVESESKTPSS